MKPQVQDELLLFPTSKELGPLEPLSSEVQCVEIKLDPALKIQDFCDCHTVSTSALFQVAWGVVLRSYTASNNISFGYFTTGDVGHKGEQVCMIDMAKNTSLLELLQQGTRGSFYRRWEGKDLQDDTDPAWNSFHTVILQNMADTAESPSAGVDYSWVSKYKIVVEIHMRREGIIASLMHWSSTLLPDQAKMLAQAFRRVMSEIVSEPVKVVSCLDLCSRQDVSQIAVWNERATPQSNDCVHNLILQQCLENPDDMAISSWDGSFTYKRLDELSSQVAARLATCGVRPETFVPLCFEKNKWAIVAILGVIKAGGAYILLDPDYPLERIHSICKAVKAELVVTSTQNKRIVEELAPRVITVGQEIYRWQHDQVDEQGVDRTSATPQNALYAVFTSGSTGVPKGVVIEHASFCAAAKSNGAALSLDRHSKVLQFANFAYDVANRDILFTLMFGGCICLPSASERSNDIASCINQHQVNWASLTPSVAGLIAPESVPTLRCLLLGGEPMTAANVASWAEKVHLMNAYGPCECAAVSSLQSRITTTSDHRNIGRGVGVALWIVDMDNPEQLLPIGATGELVIESASVGRGYINDEEGSKSSFLETTAWLDQFRPGRSGQRLYRTGDLARYNADGTINFIGRKDSQIKIHGQRVELMEVEYHARRFFAEQHPEAHDVVVGLLGGTRLAAFLNFNLTHDGPKDDIFIHDSRATSYLQSLEGYLSKVLPRHMIPSVVVPTRRIPFNMAGKIDRKRLLLLASRLSQDDIDLYLGGSPSLEVPVTAVERQLQLLWAKILHRTPQSIGRHDNFFRCGGDSIAGMKLVMAAREEGLYFTLADVFANSKLSDLALVAREGANSHVRDILPFDLLKDKDVDKIRKLAIEQCRVHENQIEDIYPFYKVPSHIDIARFERAWCLIIGKNPILRSRIVQSAAQGTFQVVIQNNICCQHHDDLDLYVAQDRSIPMRIGQPLMRLAIIRGINKYDEHRFVLTMHHAVFDGWSLPLVLEQLESAYWGDSPLPYRSFSPFVDYVLQSQRDSMQFWRSEFAAIDTVSFPSLPSVAYVPRTTKVITREIALRRGPAADGDEFTVSTKLRLAWAIILSLHTNCKDVVFGVTVNGRSAPVADVEQMTGPTIATVPLRIQLQPDMLVKDSLADLQARSAVMMQFEQLGLQNISRLGEEAEIACQFQSLLVVQPAEQNSNPTTVLTNGEATADESKYNTYALMLSCDLDVNQVNVKAVFDERVVPQSQMRRIIDHLASITQEIHSNVNQTVADLGTISPEDTAQLKQWNGSAPELQESCVHELINAQCMIQPEATAVCAWDGDFTYRDLEIWSSKLARYLSGVGVGPDMIVSLCFEKSKWTTVAMLGVMKAGGAFLLLDPSHPLTRLENICASAGVNIALCCPQTVVKATALAATVITVNAGDGESGWHRMEGIWTSPTVKPHHAVYSVFTSGSTGAPKGVLIDHRAFCTAAMSYSKHLRLSSESRVFQFSSYSFDVGIADHLTTLLVGGCICVPSEIDRGGFIENAINKLRANWTLITPSVARILRPDNVPTLKTIVHGGEKRNWADIQMWEGHAEVMNAYGPAECSVVSATQSCPDIHNGGDPNNIGFARGAVCWIVDQSDHQRLAPIGVVGELLIEGPTIGRGYVNNPEKTAKAFIQSPQWLCDFRQDTGQRVYKTGDLARYHTDGSLQILGRKDTQIKIHGQRIELREIEYHVQRSFHGAQLALVDVIVPADEGASGVLAGFILREDTKANAQSKCRALEPLLFDSPSQEFQLEALKTRAQLYDLLPNYMVPSVFVPLGYLPMSGTGKADRRVIQKHAAQLTRMELEAYTIINNAPKRAPSTKIEILLQHIMAEVIGLEAGNIGLDDSFFRLGGDSIMAMQLVACARDYGLEFNVPDVFVHPTLSDLAHTARWALHDSIEKVIPPFSLLKNEDIRKHVSDTATLQCAVAMSEIDDIYPCTALQEGLMALTAMKPGAYMGQYIFTFPSSVDIGQFQAAWEATYQAIPILRTRIIHCEGRGMFQVVVREKISWEIGDSHTAPMEVRLGGPLVRFGLSKLGDRSASFQFSMTSHHAAYDGLSLSLILRQVERAYQGATLPNQPFAPFIKYIEDVDTTNAESFWRSELSDLQAIPFPTLPSATYKPAPTKHTEHVMHLLQSRSSGRNTTLSTTIKLAWALVLAQYTASNDVVFGATVSGRSATVAGIDSLTGPTITTVPFRIHIQGDMLVEQALQAVQDKATTMAPFEQMGLQKIGRLGAEPASACLFQSLVVIQPNQEEHGLELLHQRAQEPPDSQETFYTYALTILCEPSTDYLKLRAVFDDTVLPAVRVKLILSQLAHFVQQINQHPRDTINTIDLISPEELTVLSEWNKAQPTTSQTTVQELISKRCMSQPEAEAVHSWDGNLTYRELDELSSDLAVRLRKLGVNPCTETFIPLCFEKSKWTTVAMLGVVKAGAAFVLLDPAHPHKRLQEICCEVGASMIVSSISQTALSARLAATVVPLPAFDLAFDSSDNDATGLGTVTPRPRDALYVVFTSGSSGQPKGIVVEHEAFCTGAKAQIKSLQLEPTSRVFQFSSYAFDVSIADNLTTLIAGGCICVPDEASRYDDISGAMGRLQANWAQITPSVARLLSSEKTILKTLILLGEPMSAADIDAWAGRTQLMNAYGPAECSVLSTVQPEIVHGSDPSNIGNAIGSVSWIVDKDDHHKLAPIGAIGELVIQGAIVARGYINNKEKTADVFFNNPPWLKRYGNGSNGGRIYKTGDLVRYAPDGSICYIGRKDTQIKLRGQRIELGEVEYHIRQQFHGAQAVVVEAVMREGHEHPTLMALIWCSPVSEKTHDDHPFMTPSQHFKSEAVRVESELYDILPTYMIPSVFLPLFQIPLTLSGKINRLYLRQQAAKVDLQLYNPPKVRKEKPSTGPEMVLQQVWAQILNINPDDIGVEDSFFRLGGDSITAMQVSARLKATTGLSVTVSEILQRKTISRISQHIQVDHVCIDLEGEATISAHEQTDVPFELSPIQRMFFEHAPRGHNHFNQSFFLRITRNLNIEAPEMTKALDYIVSHHSMLRARFSQCEDGRWVQRILPYDEDCYRYGQHELSSWDEVNSIVATSQTNLDIQSGPLFAVDLMTVGSEKKQYMSLVAHHLVIDLVSWRIILGDLEELLSSRKSPLTQHPSLSFQRWCHLQENYSRDFLAPEIALPFRVPHPPASYWGVPYNCNTYSRAYQEAFTMDRRVTEMLLGGANDALNTQPVEIFQAAILYSFIQVFQDRTPPTIFSEGHGREAWDAALDISRTVGWFTTMFPIFIQANKQSDILDIVAETKDTRRKIPKNGWAYFASRYLNPMGNKSFSDDNPIEILFNYLGLYQQLERSDAVIQQANQLGIKDYDVAPDMQRLSLIEVSVSVVGGCLRFNFIYNRHMKHQDAIRKWILKCQCSLRDAAETLMQSKRYTLTDFPLLPLTYKSLERFINQTLPEIGLSATQVEDSYPCSSMQRGILLSQNLNPMYYRTRFVWKVKSLYESKPVEPERLTRAWETVVQYHQIMRTVFVPGVTPQVAFQQVVLKDVVPDVYVVREDDAHYAAPCINKKGKPPHQLTMYPETAGDILCELQINHALIDGISISVLMRDLALAYDGKLPARYGPLYSDYIEYLGRVAADSGREYWKEYLHGVSPCKFPAFNDRRDEATNSLRSLSLDLSLDVLKLQQFNETNELTLSNIFQVAWGLVLQSYTGSDTVCFGYLASGRDVPLDRMEDAVGPFINMLVCRMDLVKNTSLMRMLEKNQQDYAQSLMYQHCSLADILRSASTTSTLSLFNTVMSLRRESSHSSLGLSSIRVDHVGGDDPTEFDITLHIAVKDSGVCVSFNYWTSLLSDTQAMKVANTFNQVLSEIIANPHAEADDLNIISQQDIAQVQMWNKEVPHETNSCIHDLIHQCCLVQQHDPAVCAWDGNISYGELAQLSSNLAVHLNTLGVGPGDFIPLCFEKSRWTTVAMLGVMKAGAVFVLLDPSHPLQRLQGMCDDVKATLIVASAQTHAVATTLVTRVVLIGTEESTAWQKNDGQWIPGLIDPTSPAYVAYTSGSTGRPKGAIIPHTALSTSAKSQSRAFFLNHESRVLQFASYAFDISIADNLTTLLAGGCVCVPSETDRRNNLVQAANDLQVNWANLTPSLIRVLHPNDLPTLKTLVLAGEPMQQRDITVWAPQLRVINAYGPVECSVISTVQPNISARLISDPTNIGHAIGATTWIVDKENHNRMVPVGAVGELVIQGPIVGCGYINNEKSNAAFIGSPKWLHHFRPNSTDRLYKTGDLVRYSLSDGSISYIGRKDTQVKLRGQRIELGEIEHHIRESFHNALDVVAEIVSLADRQMYPVLVAFIRYGSNLSTGAVGGKLFAIPTPEFQSEALRTESALQDVLPAHMIPSAFIPLSTVPLMSSGKVNRRYLVEQAAAISRKELQSHESPKKPSTDTEIRLQEIWAQILNIEANSIGVDDSFFRLGGDSISAMQMSARLKASGFSITVAEILKWKTISRLTQLMKSENKPVTPVRADEQIGIPFELSPIQQMFFEHASSGHNHFNQSFFLRVTKKVEMINLTQALEMITARHSMLRARFHQTDGRWTQVIQKDRAGSCLLLEHNLNTMEEAKEIIWRHQKSLNITTGPVFRVDLINIGRDSQYISLIAHHLVIDLVSWRIIFADLEELLIKGVSSSLQTMPFQSWCKIQADYSRSHLPPAKVLPFDIPPISPHYWGAEICQNTYADVLHCDFKLDKEVTDILFGVANDAFATKPVDIFQAALYLSFAETFSDRPLPTIFNEGHGREPWDPTIDLTRTVGWFTTIWPTCVSKDGQSQYTIQEVLRRVKDARLAVAGNGWSYFASRYLNADGKTVFGKHKPIEVLFNYFGLYQQLERPDALLKDIGWTNKGEVSRHMKRFSLIDVSVSVTDGCLRFEFAYNRHMRHQDSLCQWISTYRQSLEAAANTLPQIGQGYTLQDFPLLNLTYSSLDVFLGQLQKQEAPRFDLAVPNIEEAYPCSPMQQLMLRSQSKRATYYAPSLVYELKPRDSRPVDIYKVERAWQLLVDRHAALRTVFVYGAVQEGQFDQVVLKSAKARIRKVSCAQDEFHTTLSTQPPPDYGKGGLPHQLTVCCTVSGMVYIKLDMSHAIIDAASLSILFHEWCLAYENQLLDDIEPPRYSVYISSLLSRSAVENRYWREYLASIPPCLFPILSKSGHGPGKLHRVDIEIDLSRSMHNFCQENDTTVPSLIKAIWAVVLHSWVKGNTICFGYLVSGRHEPITGIENTVGAFVNLLACRIRIDEHSQFREILAAIHEDYHQSLPHHAGAIRAMVELGLSPPSEHIFNTLVNHRKHNNVQPLSIVFEAVTGQDAMEFDLVLQVDEYPKSMKVSLDYWDGRIPDVTAREIGTVFSATVAQFISDFDQGRA
ncbi:hypothetical protein RU639_008655 [Aspergillus parasiticus]